MWLKVAGDVPGIKQEHGDAEAEEEEEEQRQAQSGASKLVTEIFQRWQKKAILLEVQYAEQKVIAELQLRASLAALEAEKSRSAAAMKSQHGEELKQMETLTVTAGVPARVSSATSDGGDGDSQQSADNPQTKTKCFMVSSARLRLLDGNKGGKGARTSSIKNKPKKADDPSE